MCDHSNAYIVVKEKITVERNDYSIRVNKNLAYKNNAPFASCISKVKSQHFIDNAEDLDIVIRDGSRTAVTSKMECSVIIVNGFQPLTIITKCPILDVAAVLDPPLVMPIYNLLEYSCNYSMTSGSLWNYYRDEINDNANKNNK